MRSYPMVDFSWIGRLDRFKERIDNAAQVALNADLQQTALDAVQYKRKGGLHFAKALGVNVSWSFTRKPKAHEPEPDVAPETVTLDPSRIALAMRTVNS